MSALYSASCSAVPATDSANKEASPQILWAGFCLFMLSHMPHGLASRCQTRRHARGSGYRVRGGFGILEVYQLLAASSAAGGILVDSAPVIVDFRHEVPEVAGEDGVEGVTLAVGVLDGLPDVILPADEADAPAVYHLVRGQLVLLLYELDSAVDAVDIGFVGVTDNLKSPHSGSPFLAG